MSGPYVLAIVAIQEGLGREVRMSRPRWDQHEPNMEPAYLGGAACWGRNRTGMAVNKRRSR